VKRLRRLAAERLRALRWRSIRWRLTLLNLILLTLVLLGLVAGQYLLLSHVLTAQTAGLVRDEARPTLDRFLNGPMHGTDLNRQAAKLATDLSSHDTSGLILGPDAQILGRPDPSVQPSIGPSAAPDPARVHRALTGEPGVTYATTVGHEHVLVALVPLQSRLPGGSVLGVAQITTPLTSLDSTLHNLLLIDVVGIIAVLVLAVALSPTLVAIALTPLRRMVQTAERLGEGDLSQRVNLHHGPDEVGQLADAINQMAEHLEALFAAQQQFVSDASHELRTPLTIVQSSLELLLLQVEQDPQRVPQLLRAAHRELTRMSRLVTDLLDLARIDAGLRLELGSVDLSGIARTVFEDAQEIVLDHALCLDSAGSVCVLGDSQRVAQIARNFLDNARKFTPAGGRIVVRTGKSGDEGWLEVEDSGAGIAEQHIEAIFDRFYRIDPARSRERGGAGLGLAIAKSLAEAQHGRIEVRSRMGAGSHFRLVLPLFGVRREAGGGRREA
jgi:signal transduction histidine kinase